MYECMGVDHITVPGLPMVAGSNRRHRSNTGCNRVSSAYN